MNRIVAGALVLAAFAWFVALSTGADVKPASRPATSTSPAGTRPAATQPSNRIVIDTSMGKITIELTPQKTPITVKNFLRYVDEKRFDNTLFHRVIQGFMIQGGGFSLEGKQNETHSPIKNESRSGLSNQRGTIAMARTPNPDSATSQFFINLADNKRLDNYGGGYTAFGKVVEGMDVVDKIAAVPVRVGPLTAPEPAQPVEPVTIKSIRRTSTD